MSRNDLLTVFFTALGIMFIVLSEIDGTKGIIDHITVFIGIVVFGLLVFGCLFGFVFYARRYVEDHPYIPYAGKWAHVLCPECIRSGRDKYRIEMRVGVAIEGWSIAGMYFRKFKREYQASCSNGHSWKYDPILETNSRKKVSRAPRSEASRQKSIENMRMMRTAIHEQFTDTGEPSPEDYDS